MINVSNEFWRLMHERTDFKQNAVIKFQDGTVLELDESLFTMDNNSVTEAAGVNSIPLGVALSRSIQMELANDDERFSTYDFFGATIRLYMTFQLSESVERIEYGAFTVVSPATYGETVIIVANDDMWKSDVAYSTSITFPAQAWEVLQDSCATCGISLSTTEFLNNDFEIQEMPSSNHTHRQVIGYIAMIACGNAKINRQGYLEILSYDFSFLNEVVDGGTFNPWTGGHVADGGTFNPWTEGDVLDGGVFTDRKDYHILYNFKDSPRVDTDDVVITGVQATIQSNDDDMKSRTVLLGEEGYVLKIENPLISGNEEDALQRIGAVMIDGRMRSFEGDHIAYPIAEFMDKAFVVDRKGNAYGTILTDIDFTFFGFTTFKNSAENAVRNASMFQSQATQAIIKAQQLVKQERTARELAMQNLANALATSSGLYITTEEQEDGSKIYYMHNKKTLVESDIVWKLAAQAFGISTDGGKTYPYGFDATGDMVIKVLSSEGINADWIITGTLLANIIKTGILSDKTGKNAWDLDQGVLTATSLSVEKEISTQTLNVDTINNGQYQKTLTSSPTLYVNADTGDDDSECVNGAVFQTLQGALNSIPKFMNGKTVYIELQTNIVENATAKYFSSGNINIYLAGHTVYGYLYVYDSNHINIYGGTKSGGGQDVYGTVHPPNGLSTNSYASSIVYSNSNGYVYYLKIYGGDTPASGVVGTCALHVQAFSKVYASYIAITNVYCGFRTQTLGHLHVNTSSGVGSKYGFTSVSGSTLTLASNAQSGGNEENIYSGGAGEIRYGNSTVFETGSQTSSGNTAPTTKTTKTVTYTSDKGNAIQYYGTSSAKWRSDNTPKQGTWGYGAHTAWWFFGDDFENIANKNVSKIQITFTRNSGGNSSKVTHKFYVHNYESQPSSVKPSYKSTRVGSASVATGDSATIEITDADLIALIKAGKGICAIPTSQSKDYYSVMSGTMKVKFTYTE